MTWSLRISALSKSGDLPDSGHWIVALSGGADSTALLHILHDIAGQTGRVLTAVIVNHNLRPEAQSEAQLVAKRARSMALRQRYLQFLLKPTPLKPHAKNGRANTAMISSVLMRAKRAVFYGLVTTATIRQRPLPCAYLMVQACKGLSGIRAVTSINHVMSIRPFLSVPKEVLVAYCRDNAYDFISDPSNHNQAFERVRWRAILEQDPILGTQLYQLGKYARTISQSLWCRLDDF